ncbi:hypothetical protein BC832DRAFT_352991 [Gaertneriomyces semiglobifer]|nr:hypothetical protein BC832DRAFT_352991 [Gaertneriomyces semiglobifer]
MAGPQTTVLDYVQTSRLPAMRLFSVHTGTTATTTSLPRTDLQSVEKWTQFESQILSNRPVLAASQFTAPSISSPGNPVNSERGVQSFAHAVLHSLLIDILSALGYNDCFIMDTGGNAQVIADPDFVLVHPTRLKPLMTTEFKTPWAFPPQPDLASAYQQAEPRSRIRRAIQQVYGYMAFNHHRCGVLTTYDDTYFLRRTHSETGGCLQVAGPFRYRTTPFTLLEAYTTHLLMCMENCFYVSPTVSPSICAGASVAASLGPSYPNTPTLYSLSEVDSHNIQFIQGRDRSRMGVVVEGTFHREKVIFKIVDETKHDALTQELAHEVSVYEKLARLQGSVIPRFFGYVQVWEMLRVIVLEDCGTSLRALLQTTDNVEALRQDCCIALVALHSTGIVHGDVRLENFVVSQRGVRILDLAFAREGTEVEMADELKELNGLFITG